MWKLGLLITVIILILVITNSVRNQGCKSCEGYHNYPQRWRTMLPKCSGSGCTFYDKYGYYRNPYDYWENNKYYIRPSQGYFFRPFLTRFIRPRFYW